jgi:hypothetical protein
MLYKLFLLGTCFICFVTMGWAQANSSVKWKMEQSQPLASGEKEVVLTFTGTIPEGYFVHGVYESSAVLQNMSPRIMWDKKVSGIEAGILKEKAAPKTKTDELIQADIRYFEKEVVFTISITLVQAEALAKGRLFYAISDFDRHAQIKSFDFRVK